MNPNRSFSRPAPLFFGSPKSLIGVAFRSVLGRVFLSLFFGTCLFFVGCETGKSDPEPENQAAKVQPPLRVLVFDDSELAQAIERLWKSHSEQPLEIRQAESLEIPKSGRLQADVVIYPSALLGELAENQLIGPLQDDMLNHDSFALRDILRLQSRGEVVWGKQVYAVSFGSPQLMLFYRADLFATLNIQPPTTWAEYDALAERLSHLEQLGDFKPADGESWSGSIEPLAPGWAGQMLLARSAAYARHASQYSTLFKYSTMEPLITSPPFVRALEELTAAAKLRPQGEPYSLDQARLAFLQGRSAMAISWPVRDSEAQEELDKDDLLNVGISLLPGAKQVYNSGEQTWDVRQKRMGRTVPLLGISGRLGSITRETRYPRDAFFFLARLAGKNSSLEISPQSRHTALYRSSHLEHASRWLDAAIPKESAPLYAESMEQALATPQWLFCLRLPGREEYLTALDEAVRASLAGEKTAAKALADAAQKWKQVTNKFGLEEQKAAYAKSIGVTP